MAETRNRAALAEGQPPLWHTRQRSLEPDRPRQELTGRHLITAAPAEPPAILPWPRGDLGSADLQQLRAVVNSTFPTPSSRPAAIYRGLKVLIDHLAQFPADTWQDRWIASGLNEDRRSVRELEQRPQHRGFVASGLKAMCCLRVIRPSLDAFRANRFVHYERAFISAQADPALDRFAALVAAQSEASEHFRRLALYDVAVALTTQGIAYRDLTPEAFLHYAIETRLGRYGRGYDLYVGHLAWDVLLLDGQFPPSTPATLRTALRAPQMTAAELVDLARIRNREIAAIFTTYLTRRSHDLDYSSLKILANSLCHVFWREIEQINPDQADFALSEQTYQQWRQRAERRRDGRSRVTSGAILTIVRAFYIDLQGWATEDPATWARWVAPSPISGREMKIRATHRRRTKERMDNRTRVLQPLLPVLSAAAEQEHAHTKALLSTASSAGRGELVAVGSKIYRRLFTAGDQRHRGLHGQANVRVVDVETGAIVNATAAEQSTFWLWAVIETLRQTGVRIEELLELTHLSIRQYVRPNGEVIALLVIAPSKTDRERVIPVSAELFHVLACVLRRLTTDRVTVPLATYYDKTERRTSEPAPYLFQNYIGQRRQVISQSFIRDHLTRLCRRLAPQHPALAGIAFTPHDFRRLFATDLINHGLPIHIGAALLGHLNIQTTHGYVAVFNEDLVRHYQAHLAERRAQRPQSEYRPATEQEWDEFEQHFDKRKVELGQCGRPYGTPCSHEHACIRCPMLRIDSTMLTRLEEIRADLITRRAHAEQQGWLGEIEGIDLTLQFAADKVREAQRATKYTTVELGMPRIAAVDHDPAEDAAGRRDPKRKPHDPYR